MRRWSAPLSVGCCRSNAVSERRPSGINAVGHVPLPGREPVTAEDQQVDRTDRHVPLHSRQGIHFRPEVDRIAQFALRDLTQPIVILAQDERHSP